ncbi:MAG: YrdB family protein [Anaerolineaceae bacterium]
MDILKMSNLGLRFLLELLILVILGYWGFKTGTTPATRTLLGIGSPVLFAVVWGIFMAPKSSLQLGAPWYYFLEVILFALSGWALHSAGKTNLAIAFGALYLINRILLLIWRQ